MHDEIHDDIRVYGAAQVALAAQVAARNAHLRELRHEIASLRRRIIFWKWLAIGMTLACITCAVLAR